MLQLENFIDDSLLFRCKNSAIIVSPHTPLGTLWYNASSPWFSCVVILSPGQVDPATLNLPRANASKQWQWRDVDVAMGQ